MRPVIYIPDCPLSSLTCDTPRPKALWFDRLRADIATRGLKSPILVRNGWVQVGRNRFMVASELGWDTIPVLWQGYDVEPPGLSLEEARAYIKDGNLVVDIQGWLRLSGAMPPEHMEYPNG